MAHFMGIVRGRARSLASRLGSKDSGITVEAGSWEGGVRVHLYQHDGADYAIVSLIQWHGAGANRILYDGPVSGEKSDAAAKE